MPPIDQAYFGTDAQRALLRRGRALYDICGNNPRYSYYGRGIGVADNTTDAVDLVAAMARLQGSSNIANIKDSDLPALRSTAESMGLSVTHYARWIGGADSLKHARAIIADHALPDDLSMIWIATDTPPETLASFADTALACGVLPPATAVLTGTLKPGVATAAVDGAGKVVSCAGGASYLHTDHAKGHQECWWGMLATDPDRRGQRLSLILGAHAMIAMHERYGFTVFFTGVEPGNAPSEAICSRMGLARDNTGILTIADPSLLPGGRMTK